MMEIRMVQILGPVFAGAVPRFAPLRSTLAALAVLSRRARMWPAIGFDVYQLARNAGLLDLLEERRRQIFGQFDDRMVGADADVAKIGAVQPTLVRQGTHDGSG